MSVLTPSVATKVCKVCSVAKELSEYYPSPGYSMGVHSKCKACTKKIRKEHYWKDPDKGRQNAKNYFHANKDHVKRQKITKAYGIPPEQFDQMRKEQDYCCRICGAHESTQLRGLFVDHCHDSNKVRGLLCHHCNALLGHAKDKTDILLKAIDYLHQTETAK